MKLKPEVKTEWVKRLRSGDYPQGHGYLKKDGKYCCLGILSEMAVEAGATTFMANPHAATIFELPTSDGQGMMPSWTNKAVVLYAAESAEEAEIEGGGNWWVERYPGTTTSLAWMNDNGYTFDAIANVIEEQL